MKTTLSMISGILLIALAGCQLPQTGSLTISLQGLSSRSVASNDGVGNLVRLQLIRNNKIVPLAGKEFVEQGLAGQTVTLDGLSPGSGYTLTMVTGEKRPSGFLEVGYVKTSDPFEISSGLATEVTLAVSKSNDRSPFTLLEAAEGGVHGAASGADGAGLWFLEGAKVKDEDAKEVADTSGAGSVLGLSYDAGAAKLWLNTASGIAVQNTTLFDAPNMVDSDGNTIQPRVETSGKFTLYYVDKDSKTVSSTFAYYSGPKSVAGLRLNAETKWTTLESLLGSIESTKDLLDGKVIRGVAATSRFLYLSTPIGLFRVASDLVGQDVDKLGTNLSDGKDANGNSIVLDPSDASLVIGPVSAYSDADSVSTGSKAYAFGGTRKGLFAGAVDSATGNTSDSKPLPLVAGTTGYSISQLSTAPVVSSTGTVYTAAYASNTRTLVLLENLQVKKTIPAMAGLPAGSPKFTWYVDGTTSKTLYLVVTGDDATVRLNVAEWTD